MFEVNWPVNPYYPMAQVHFSKRDIIGATGLAAVATNTWKGVRKESKQ
jgi:hypothetical protein